MEARPVNLKSVEQLACWQAATAVRRFVCRLIRGFPAEEKFALADDMRRAARSATHNIAEGYGRFHYKENIQFCRVSRGSLYELIDQLITARDERYIGDDDYRKAREAIDQALRLLNGYLRYLAQRKMNSEDTRARGEEKN